MLKLLENKNVVGLFVIAVAFGLATVTLAGPDLPRRFLPGTDRQLVNVTNPITQESVSAWQYRNGAETDIAIAIRTVDGRWSEPTLIGLDDGESQRQPALAVDGNGTLYLAFVEAGRVLLTFKPLAAKGWSTPSPVVDSRLRGSSPSLLVAANRRLVVAFVENGRARMVQRHLAQPGRLPQMNDGPDPAYGGGDKDEPPTGDTDNTVDPPEHDNSDVMYTGESPDDKDRP